jgi:hypothetical protein
VTLEQRLREYGLYLRGITRLNPDELESYGFPVDRAAIALVGNIGSSYWPLFSESPEYDDGAADPLDRWSRRVAETVAAEFSLQPVYPFEGPPYYPFQRWAQRAEALEQSPIGVMMHPEFGLWHSYRFAATNPACDVARWTPSTAAATTSRPAPATCVKCRWRNVTHSAAWRAMLARWPPGYAMSRNRAGFTCRLFSVITAKTDRVTAPLWSSRL